MFDTHCHLNLSVFSARDGSAFSGEEKVTKVIMRAKKAGVDYFVVPGTDVETSKKAVGIAEKFAGVYAAAGIHPHHVRKYQISNIKYQNDKLKIKNDLKQIEKLLNHKKIVAVGEIGLDRHIYQKTKYENYQVSEEFFNLQKLFFIEQLKLAREYKKAVIIHNREAKEDLLKILNDHWDSYFSGRMVFHCCEPEKKLLIFAKKKKIFIGVDGDVTYIKKKQKFVKQIPQDLLVLETDSPFLMPKLSMRRSSHNKNEPKNLPLIAKFISNLLSVSINQLIDTTTENAKRLFSLV